MGRFQISYLEARWQLLRFSCFAALQVQQRLELKTSFVRALIPFTTISSAQKSSYSLQNGFLHSLRLGELNSNRSCNFSASIFLARMRILTLILWLFYCCLQTSVAAFATRQQRPARQSRGVQKCFAMATEQEKKLTFESNKRSVSIFRKDG
jgi:hypothetical protein